MSNEILLIINLIAVYLMAVAAYCLFGKKGVLCWNVLATVAANIEVMILIRAYGLEQTLGNILFASTFVATDILSENHGKKEASLAVKTGIAASLAFIIISHIWLIYTPSENDFITPAMIQVFSNTPRIMIAGFVVYGIVQLLDVWLYHKIWEFTTKKCGESKKLLWLRNNIATLLSQLINAILFNVFAFAGVYSTGTLISIILSTYLIYIITSIADTPVVYFARMLKNRGHYSILYRE